MVEKKLKQKRKLLVGISIVVVIGIIIFFMTKKENKIDTSPKETQAISGYMQLNAKDMLDDLKENPSKAEKKYKGQLVEITGKVYNIDPERKYINIDGVSDEFTLTGISCYLQTEEQINYIKDINIGQITRVKGKITDVEDALGYVVDVEDILTIPLE